MMDERFWQADAGRARGVARVRFDCPEDRRDAEQESWVKLLRSWNPGIRNPAGWGYRVGRTVALDVSRRRSRERRELVLDQPMGEAS